MLSEYDLGVLTRAVQEANDYGQGALDCSVAHELKEDHFLIWTVCEGEACEIRFILRVIGEFRGDVLVSLACEDDPEDTILLSARGWPVFAAIYA